MPRKTRPQSAHRSVPARRDSKNQQKAIYSPSFYPLHRILHYKRGPSSSSASLLTMTEREHSTSPHRRSSWSRGVSALGAKFGFALTNVDENGADSPSTKETDVSSLITKVGDMEVENRGELSASLASITCSLSAIMALEIREISTGTSSPSAVWCDSTNLISLFHAILSPRCYPHRSCLFWRSPNYYFFGTSRQNKDSDWAWRAVPPGLNSVLSTELDSHLRGLSDRLDAILLPLGRLCQLSGKISVPFALI